MPLPTGAGRGSDIKFAATLSGMGRVGDPERDMAASVLRSAYVHGYLTHEELTDRLGEVFSARSARELVLSVRRLPGSGWFTLSTSLRPLVSAGTLTLRRRAARVLRRLALAVIAATSAVVVFGVGVWTLAAGLSTNVILGFLLVWLAVNAPALLIWRRARRLLR